MQKYGFIYIWYDCKRCKFYLGRHWGTEFDGYVCSSRSMREAYRRRPQDFRRRIIKRIYSCVESLVIEEQRWLNMIKPSECGVRYYNKTLKSSTPSTRGYKHSEETKRKISTSNKGKIVSIETREKIRKANERQFQNIAQIELRKQKSKQLWSNSDYVEKQKQARSREGFYQGFRGKHTEQTKQLLREQRLGKSKHTESTKKAISEFVKNSVWITNGINNKRINKNLPIPAGYVRGKT